MTEQERPSYFRLISAGEPFRLLFPLGTLIGIVGVLLWPAYTLHWWATYPGTMHPRIMTEGFLTCFVVGFLGTALPRLLDVPRMTWMETAGFAVGLCAVTGFHLAGFTIAGDVAFLAVLSGLMLSLGIRGFLFRKDTPPPGFVLVAGGILLGMTGVALLILMQLTPESLPFSAFRLGGLFLYQGYLLLPIMGVGAFLLPRFFGLPSRQSFPESLALPPGWVRRALFAAACGGLVVGSFFLEAAGGVRWASVLRLVAVMVYFLTEVPVHRAGLGEGNLLMALRLALFSIPAGYLLIAVWPERAAAFLHVVMIAGFSLLTFTVATRVVLGHSGQSAKFRLPLRPVLWLTAALTLATITRVVAELLPASRMSHLSYSAVIWVAGALVWGVAILPSVRKADTEES